MNRKQASNPARRSFLQHCLWLPIGAVTLLLNGCAAPMWARAQPRKTMQDKFSCGEDCPPATKETRRTK